MKNIISIIKKEFARFFKDKRMVLNTLIIPGLMIYILYSFIGSGMSSSFKPSNDYEYKVSIYNETQLDDTFRMYMDTLENNETLKIKVTKNSTTLSQEDAIKKIKDKEIDLVLVYPDNFMEMSGKDNIISMYYDSTNKNSSAIFETYSNWLDNYENTVANLFDINTDPNITYNQATEKEISGQVLSMMLPMLLIMFLFSGCISIAPESIAGEKERGTIATLLVTPINRKDLAIGKIISLSVIGLLSGLSSFIGTMFSLPKMLGDGIKMTSNVYGFTDYLWLLLLILSCVLLFTAMIGIISAYAKSVKEATTYTTPILICVTLLGMTTLFNNGTVTNHLLYLIPVYNTIQAMTGIFSFTPSIINIVETILSNLVYTVIMIIVLAKMFNNEKVMFNK